MGQHQDAARRAAWAFVQQVVVSAISWSSWPLSKTIMDSFAIKISFVKMVQ